MNRRIQIKDRAASINEKHFAKLVTIKCSECVVKDCSILTNCSEGCLSEISSLKRVLFFAKGQRIMLEGNRENGIYFVKSGKIKICRSVGNGPDRILYFASSGDLLGFSMATGEIQRSASAVAITDVFVCHIRRSEFMTIVNKYPELSYALISMFATSLKKAEDRFINLAILPVKSRVVDALLTISNVGDELEKTQLNMSRKDIANLASTTKEQVSKTLSGLRSERLINTKGRRIDILDIAALRKLVK